MKQVSNAIKFFVLSSPRLHPIPQRKAFSNCHLFPFFAGFVILICSCQKDELNKCSPFKGKFTLSHTETGVIGTGVGSHIGRFTLDAKSTGSSTITAANGDQIFTTFTVLKYQPLDNGMAQVDLDNTITGGTGRFARATGRFEINALENVNLGTGSATFDGTICY